MGLSHALIEISDKWKELFPECQAHEESDVSENTNHKLDSWQDSAFYVFK